MTTHAAHSIDAGPVFYHGRLKTITKVAAYVFGLPYSVFIGQGRWRNEVKARFAAARIMKDFGASLSQTGRLLGGRDHTTVLNGLRKADVLIASDPVFAAKVERIRRIIAVWDDSRPLAREIMAGVGKARIGPNNPPAVKFEGLALVPKDLPRAKSSIHDPFEDVAMRSMCQAGTDRMAEILRAGR